MPVSRNYLEYILEQLGALVEVRQRRMFGAVGLYSGDLFFALINNDTLYFKVDDSNRAAYTDRGMPAFCPKTGRGIVSMNYFEVPADIIEDAGELIAWARWSVAVAARSGRAGNSK